MRSAFLLKTLSLTAIVLSSLQPAHVLQAQSSVRGPLQPEHVPSLKFQSFSPERWDSSSFAPPDAIRWWQEARFGMFIHFGVASLRGVPIGWGRATHLKPDGKVGILPDEVYDNLYKEFTIGKFDAAKWVSLAQSAGMKYIIVVTKHHDGFHMWDTAFSDYKITKSPFGRDYVRELVDAAHAANMPIGFYFAQREWYHPQYDPRGAYPGRDHKKYIEYQFNAVRELLTKYGKIDVLWFDAAWWGGMFKEEDWDSERLYRMARKLQPRILINNRASIPGDFDTPEQHIGAFQSDRPWESCVTLTGSWGYKPGSPIKTPKQVIDTLIQCVTGDGNLLLNVGPMPDGTIQTGEISALRIVGEWMSKYGESVYSTRGGPLRNAGWGGTTHRGDTVYVHVLSWPGETLWLRPIDEKILSARALTGGEVRVEQSEKGISLTLPEKNRDPFDTVIALKLDRPVSRFYPGPATPSIFDGPGYGKLISGDATFEASSAQTGKDVPADHPSLFTGKNKEFSFHTANEASPWIVIDLGTKKNVKGVRITNRPGITRADGLELSVSEDKSRWTRVWKAASDSAIWEVPVTCFREGAQVPGVPARYLKLQLHPSSPLPLALKQVEVFGED